jgi:hypothetical protein
MLQRCLKGVGKLMWSSFLVVTKERRRQVRAAAYGQHARVRERHCEEERQNVHEHMLFVGEYAHVREQASIAATHACAYRLAARHRDTNMHCPHAHLRTPT